MFSMFIKLYYWKYSGDRGPHIGHPCHEANKFLSSTFLRQIPWRKWPKTTLTQTSQRGVIPHKAIMCREQIMLLKWKRKRRLDDDMKGINSFFSLVPFLKRHIFLRVQTVISTQERKNHSELVQTDVLSFFWVVINLNLHLPEVEFTHQQMHFY